MRLGRRLLGLTLAAAIMAVAFAALLTPVDAQGQCNHIYLAGGTLAMCNERYANVLRCHGADGSVTTISQSENYFTPGTSGPPWLKFSNNSTACGDIRVWELSTGEWQWMFGPDAGGKTRIMVNPFDTCGYGWHEINGERFDVRLLTDDANLQQTCADIGRDVPFPYAGKDYSALPDPYGTCYQIILGGGTLALCDERFGTILRCHARDGSVHTISQSENYFTQETSGPPWLKFSNNTTPCGTLHQWELSTGERQWMFGPEADGKVRVMVNPFDTCGYGWHELNGERYNVRLLTDNAVQKQACVDAGRDVPFGYGGKDYSALPDPYGTCFQIILGGGTLALCDERYGTILRCHGRDGSISTISQSENYFTQTSSGPPWLKFSSNTTACGPLQQWELSTGERQWMFGPEADGKMRIMVNPFDACGYGWHEINGEKTNVRLLTDDANQRQRCIDAGRDIPWPYPGKQ
jgi:hypothetical protein